MFLAPWVAVAETAHGTWQRPVVRLGPTPGAPGSPFVVLDEEQRDVLFAFPFADLVLEQVQWDRERGAVHALAVLPPDVAVSSRLEVQLRVAGPKGGRSLPSRIVEVSRDDFALRRVAIAFEDASLRAEGGTLRLKARALPQAALISHTTGEVAIPQRATLELGFGLASSVAEGAENQEPTLFFASVCAEDRCQRVFEEAVVPQAGAAKWIDRGVSLREHAGRRVTLRLEASRSVPERANGLPVWAVPTIYTERARAEGETSLLLISLDTLRADHLGAYGYRRDTSPFIDREIAARGTLFERCISAATTTGPSHMSMFTGLAPTVHGVYGSSYFRALADGVPTLAGVLLGQGFETAAVTENAAMGAYRGFNRGFSSYYENKRRELRGAAGHIENTLARSLAWLERNRAKRFFLFVHTYQVHAPFTPPPAFRKLFEGDGLDGRRARLLPKKWHPIQYDREIRYTDRSLEGFFTQAEARGLLENTIVVLLSDHGEEFGEHGAFGHGPGVHDEVLRVPLIVRGPGIAAGRRIGKPVSLVDLMATVLDLARVDAKDAPGHSFADDARVGVAPDAPANSRPVFSEARAGKGIFLTKRHGPRGARVEVPVHAIRSGGRKLIRNPGPPHPSEAQAAAPGKSEAEGPVYRYFDLTADPGEWRNRWDPAVEEAARLHDLLEQHIAEVEAARSVVEDAVHTETGIPGVLDADRREKLEALGYLE